jgi:mRNA interferase MazF
VVIAQGDVFWVEFPDAVGLGPGFVRPAVIVQGDALNRSALSTTVCVPLTSNTKWAAAPGNVLLGPGATGLPKESVANVSQIVAIDRGLLRERVGKLSKAKLSSILQGIDVVLGR